MYTVLSGPGVAGSWSGRAVGTPPDMVAPARQDQRARLARKSIAGKGWVYQWMPEWQQFHMPECYFPAAWAGVDLGRYSRASNSRRRLWRSKGWV